MPYGSMAPSRASFREADSEKIKKYVGVYRYLYNAEVSLLREEGKEAAERDRLSMAGGNIYIALEGFCEDSDFISGSDYDPEVIDSFCRSISILIRERLGECGNDPDRLEFLKKKGTQTIFVETRYHGNNCISAMFPKNAAEKLLENDSLFQTYDLTVDFDSMTAETKYRQLV